MSAREPGRCPRCAAAADHGQEYCLECGLRLDADTLAAEPTHGGRAWVPPALVALLVATLGAGASIALSSDTDARETISVATGGSRTVAESGPLLTAPEPTTPATTGAAARPKAAPKPLNPAVAVWPRPRRGWTIVLVSLPQNAGRAAAEAKANEARDGGLRRVGVLDSSRYASLHPGYYVVFTGVFETQTEAVSALQRARAVFPAAYQREIIP